MLIRALCLIRFDCGSVACENNINFRVKMIVIMLKYPNTKLLLVDKDKDNDHENETQESSKNLLPPEADAIPKAGKDLLVRLLEANPKYRLKSVLGLQKIAMFKDLDIKIETLKEISPLELLRKENIPINAVYSSSIDSGAIESSAFQEF